MSNPIKSLLPTPLSMHFISDLNALAKLPLSLYKFFINCALTGKSSQINIKDQNLLTSILKRQQINSQIISGAINSVKLIENISQKVFKLMKTSQPQQIETNLQNCQKYLGTVLSENTMIDNDRLAFLLQKLISFVHESLNSQPRAIETKFGIVQWSVYNLKKANISLSTQKNVKFQNRDQNKEQKSNDKSLRQINKMYVKVSFDENFSTSGIQKLILSRFESVNQGLTESKIEVSNSNEQLKSYNKIIKSRSITMSLIDFRLFMQELQKVKNLNS